jgi:hypothetical protein
MLYRGRISPIFNCEDPMSITSADIASKESEFTEILEESGLETGDIRLFGTINNDRSLKNKIGELDLLILKDIPEVARVLLKTRLNDLFNLNGLTFSIGVHTPQMLGALSKDIEAKSLSFSDVVEKGKHYKKVASELDSAIKESKVGKAFKKKMPIQNLTFEQLSILNDIIINCSSIKNIGIASQDHPFALLSQDAKNVVTPLAQAITSAKGAISNGNRVDTDNIAFKVFVANQKACFFPNNNDISNHIKGFIRSPFTNTIKQYNSKFVAIQLPNSLAAKPSEDHDCAPAHRRELEERKEDSQKHPNKKQDDTKWTNIAPTSLRKSSSGKITRSGSSLKNNLGLLKKSLVDSLRSSRGESQTDPLRSSLGSVSSMDSPRSSPRNSPRTR